MRTQLIYVKNSSLFTSFGLQLDKDQNNNLKRGTEGRIDSGTGPQIWVIPTDEEGRIAKETRQVVEVSQNTSPEVSLA